MLVRGRRVFKPGDQRIEPFDVAIAADARRFVGIDRKARQQTPGESPVLEDVEGPILRTNLIDQ